MKIHHTRHLLIWVAVFVSCKSVQEPLPPKVDVPPASYRNIQEPDNDQGIEETERTTLPFPTWVADQTATETLHPADLELLTTLADAAYLEEQSLQLREINLDDEARRCLEYQRSNRLFTTVPQSYTNAFIHPRTDRLYRATIERLNRSLRNFEYSGATCDPQRAEIFLAIYQNFYHEVDYLVAIGQGKQNPFLDPADQGRMTTAQIENAEAEFRAILATEADIRRAQRTSTQLTLPPDDDGDGVSDRLDKCPDQPGTPAHDGCPLNSPVIGLADTDGDGVEDSKDMCPDVPGRAEFYGCPYLPEPGLPSPPNPSTGSINTNSREINVLRFYDRYNETSVSLQDHSDALYGYVTQQSTVSLSQEERELNLEVIDHYLNKYGADDPERATQLRLLRGQLLAGQPEEILPAPIVEGPRDTATIAVPVPIPVDTATLPELPCIVGTFERGVLSFNRIPASMEPFRPYDVYIKIHHTAEARDQADLVDKINRENPNDDDGTAQQRDPVTGALSPIRAEPLRVSRYMFAEIKATNERAFTITERFDSGLQEIECGDSTVWHYIIEPQIEGRHVLLFNLYYSEDGETTFPMSEAGERREIMVSVTKAGFPMWLLAGGGALLLGLIGLLFWFFRKKKQTTLLPVAVTAQQLESLEKLVRNGEIGRALNRIVDLIDSPEHPVRRQAVETLAMYNQAERDHNLGSLTLEQFQQKRSKATRSILDIIDQLRNRTASAV